MDKNQNFFDKNKLLNMWSFVFGEANENFREFLIIWNEDDNNEWWIEEDFSMLEETERSYRLKKNSFL